MKLRFRNNNSQTSDQNSPSLGTLHVFYKSDKIQTIELKSKKITLGKDKSADVVLSGLKISKKHAILTYNSTRWSIVDNSSMIGTFVNDQRIFEHDHIQDDDIIRIQDYSITITERKPETTLVNSHNESTANVSSIPTISPTRTNQHSTEIETAPPSHSSHKSICASSTPEYNRWREKLHHEVVQAFDLRRQNVSNLGQEELRETTSSIAKDILQGWTSVLPKTVSKADLIQAVIDDIVGLGPLEFLLKDRSVSEIMVNAADEIFVERDGRIEKSTLTFANDNAVLAVIDRIITPLGRRIDHSSPMVDARLKDGSRVNAIIPPLAIKGPCITIRKFPEKRLGLNDLESFGSLDSNMAAFFKIAVSQGKNILVSGGTGTGKTTLLNALSNLIPHHERVITIEDAAELQLSQPDLVALESKPANMEGHGAIQIRDLVKNALRMRPNRIVVGECRGAEALDMLQAMNTGHDGSLTTLHANTPRDAMSRLEVMVLMAGMDIPVQAIREQISSAIHLIVQQTRFPCGARKITHVTEVVGIEAGTIQLQDIFHYRRQGIQSNGKIQGQFEATGFIPGFYQILAEYGHTLDTSLFFNQSNQGGS